jgi:hypothetical protein
MEVDWGNSGFLYGNNDTRFGEQEAIAYRLQAQAPSPPGSSKKTGSFVYCSPCRKKHYAIF